MSPQRFDALVRPKASAKEAAMTTTETGFDASVKALTGATGRREAVRAVGSAGVALLAALGLAEAAKDKKRANGGGKGGGQGRHGKNRQKQRADGQGKPDRDRPGPAPGTAESDGDGAVEAEALGLLRGPTGPTGPTGATGPAGITTPVFADNAFRLTGSADATKQLAFEVDGLSAGATRTLAAPDADTTLVGTDAVQTLTRKTVAAATRGDPALVVQGAPGQSAPLLVLQDSEGTEQLRLDARASNTAVGRQALQGNTEGSNNTALGSEALENNTASDNTAVGSEALLLNTTGTFNTAVGRGALFANTAGPANTAVGQGALATNTTGGSNTAVGRTALQNNASGSNNTAVGQQALSNNTADSNTAVGFQALLRNTNGFTNTAVGAEALQNNTTGSNNTALGNGALNGTNFSNTTGVGVDSAVTGVNQVQLGNSATTTFAFGAVQNRSDLRDKADVRDTVLGLEFIATLRPVDFRWDLRDDYRLQPPEAPGPQATEAERAAYQAKLAAWGNASRLGKLAHDGGKKRTRFHHGLVAQEVAEVIARTGVDFGGYQDHTVKGGDDVLSLGYSEFIAPLIKAVQELAARNEDLAAENARILARLARLEGSDVGAEGARNR